MRPAEGHGVLSVQTVRWGPEWEADGVARCSEALLGHGAAVGLKQVQVGENSSALALGGLWMRASLPPRWSLGRVSSGLFVPLQRGTPRA